jgi:hypothetical protein
MVLKHDCLTSILSGTVPCFPITIQYAIHKSLSKGTESDLELQEDKRRIAQYTFVYPEINRSKDLIYLKMLHLIFMR